MGGCKRGCRTVTLRKHVVLLLPACITPCPAGGRQGWGLPACKSKASQAIQRCRPPSQPSPSGGRSKKENRAAGQAAQRKCVVLLLPACITPSPAGGRRGWGPPACKSKAGRAIQRCKPPSQPSPSGGRSKIGLPSNLCIKSASSPYSILAGSYVIHSNGRQIFTAFYLFVGPGHRVNRCVDTWLTVSLDFSRLPGVNRQSGTELQRAGRS